MLFHEITDPEFAKYGCVITGYDTSALDAALAALPVPADYVKYEATHPSLEKLPFAKIVTDSLFGGIKAQMGYVCGYNTHLDALEYHRSSEFNYAQTDLVLILGLRSDVNPASYTYDTAKAEFFHVPAGTLFETYATTLHYAPCSYKGQPFQMLVALPEFTNTGDPAPVTGSYGEEKLMTCRNKWLIAHPDAKIQGAHNGLTGENWEV